MSKKVQYQRKEVLSQSSDSEDPLQLRRSLDSEDEDSTPASNQQKSNASKNSQLSKNSSNAPADNATRPKRTRSRRRRSQKSQQSVVASTTAQAPVKVEQPAAKADQQKRKASDAKPVVTKETTTQPARDKSPTVAHARRSSRDKADPKVRSQRGQRNEKPVKFVPKQQKAVVEPKPVETEAPKPAVEAKTSQLEALHGGQTDVRQAPDERTAPQSPSSEQLSPVIVTPVSPGHYIDQSMSMHPVYMPPAAYGYMPPSYYYPYVPQPMPYYYYPSAEYYHHMQPQHGAYVDARGQVYYDLEPQLLQQQIRQQLFSQPQQMANDKENMENLVEQPVAHTEQKFVEVIKIHDAPKPEQTAVEAAPAAATETPESTQPLSTEHVRSKSNIALKARNAPRSKKAPVWVPKSTVKTTVTPTNVS